MGLSVFAAAAEAPDRLAVITDDEALTYADLARRVGVVVHQLHTRSLAGPRPVALVAEPDLASLVTVHALVALGTPALLLHPRTTDHEREAMMAAAAVAGLVEPPALTSAIPPAHHGIPGDEPPPPDDRPLAIIPTSGTSGRPRGVVLSRRAFTAAAAASAANLGWEHHDRWLLPLPLAHVGGLSILTRCLLARRAVVLAGGRAPRELVDTVARHRVTLLSLVPTLLARILDFDPPLEPPPSLRAILLGGAPASPALLERAADRRWPVLTTYGLTEACSQVATQPRGTVNRGALGCGPPLPGVQLRIGDDDAILVRGPTLFSGYVPANATGLADRSDPLVDGWFPTGDRGRLDEGGNLHVLGRRADRIITGGENVDPVEVEHALERLEGVREACVFGVPDEEWGEVVCAALVLEDAGAAGTTEEAAGEAVADRVPGLRSELAAFKVPRRLAFLPVLPRNATGKVDRDEAAALAGPRLRGV